MGLVDNASGVGRMRDCYELDCPDVDVADATTGGEWHQWAISSSRMGEAARSEIRQASDWAIWLRKTGYIMGGSRNKEGHRGICKGNRRFRRRQFRAIRGQNSPKRPSVKAGGVSIRHAKEGARRDEVGISERDQ